MKKEDEGAPVSDFEDRLAALDPVAGQPYQHRDLDALISRITSRPATSKSRWWQNLQLKLSGTLIAGALVTAGSVALFQGPNVTLPVLALQATSGVDTPATSGSGYTGAMEIYVKFNFSAGPGLSATTPTNASYQLQIPSGGSAETSRLAQIFGISGSPVNTSGDGVDWSVTDSSGSSLDYANSGVPQWSYSASPSTTAMNSTLSDLPSQSTLANDVQHYLSMMGYGFSVSAPSFGTSSATDATSANSTSTEDVTYTVDVDGMSTDRSVSFSVDANNKVVNASGPAFNVASTTNYPLQSLAAGVSALNVEQQKKYPATSTPSTPSTSPSTDAGSSDTTSTTPTGPPIVDVTLNSDSITLETYQLTDGSVWLLPVYNYEGVERNIDGSSSTGSWYELAVDPTYVHVSENSSSGGHGVVNY
jgi:hypothetical protein